jgi:hypothetical protein
MHLAVEIGMDSLHAMSAELFRASLVTEPELHDDARVDVITHLPGSSSRYHPLPPCRSATSFGCAVLPFAALAAATAGLTR